MKVVIIGSGNVATVLGKKILSAGHEITQVVGRNIKNVTTLSSTLNSASCYNMLNINTSSDIYIISVSDSSITGVAEQLILNDKLVVHTAAAVSKDVLANSSLNYGVLYPLQTLKKEAAAIPPIPVLVDGSNEEVKRILFDFARQWADPVGFATDEERLKLHVGAVIVSNFTNYLFTVANEYFEHEELDFNLLKPLIEETIVRIEKNKPSAVQTGPAVRNDLGTIRKHEQLLENYPLFKNLYYVISNSIIEYYSHKGI